MSAMRIGLLVLMGVASVLVALFGLATVLAIIDARMEAAGAEAVPGEQFPELAAQHVTYPSSGPALKEMPGSASREPA